MCPLTTVLCTPSVSEMSPGVRDNFADTIPSHCVPPSKPQLFAQTTSLKTVFISLASARQNESGVGGPPTSAFTLYIYVESLFENIVSIQPLKTSVLD